MYFDSKYFENQTMAVNYFKTKIETTFFPKFLEVSQGTAAWNLAMQEPHANYLKFFDPQQWQMRIEKYRNTNLFDVLSLEELQIMYIWIETLKPFYLLTTNIHDICEKLLDYKEAIEKLGLNFDLSHVYQMLAGLITQFRAASTAVTNYLTKIYDILDFLANYCIKDAASYHKQFALLPTEFKEVNFLEQCIQYYTKARKDHPLLSLLKGTVEATEDRSLACRI